MSGKFSSTAASFGASHLLRQEETIREICQQEFLGLFEDIKMEIETKIKSIDRNIIELRTEMKALAKQNKPEAPLGQLVERLDKVESEIQLLRYQQQFQLKSSRARSFDKERKPIFRKNSQELPDFGTLVLELQDNSPVKKPVISKEEASGKPPLPTEGSRQKSWLSLDSNGQLEVAKNNSKQLVRSDSNESGKPKRNPVLDDSGSIHRWLHENNNRQSSCFNSIIREEDIEESVFY